MCLSAAMSHCSAQRMSSLWSALQHWDRQLAQHGERTAEIAVWLAERLVEERQLDAIEWAGRLHDIGKVAVPRAILDKKGSLTEEERRIVRVHPAYSFVILRHADLDAEFLQIVLFHHERFDGKGYPVGLKGEDIPLAARILSVADVYSALTSDRPYRKSYPSEQALALMRKGVPTAFDPRVFETLQRLGKVVPWQKA